MQASILNRISDHEAYKATYPTLVGNGELGAHHELHVYLSKRDPDKPTVERFFKIVKLWNDTHPNKSEMEACYLGIPYRKPDGSSYTVLVMQSARYFHTNDQDEAIREVQKDAAYFAENGFEVEREKIESSVYGIKGIPQTNEEAKQHGRSFEFHIHSEF